jgi:hypothetical protein
VSVRVASAGGWLVGGGRADLEGRTRLLEGRTVTSAEHVGWTAGRGRPGHLIILAMQCRSPRPRPPRPRPCLPTSASVQAAVAPDHDHAHPGHDQAHPAHHAHAHTARPQGVLAPLLLRRMKEDVETLPEKEEVRV